MATHTDSNSRPATDETLRDDGSISNTIPPPPTTITVMGTSSPGVKRMDAISAHLTLFDRAFIASGVFLVAYAVSLDGSVSYTYQTTALASFKHHSHLASVNVVRSVISAVGQPIASKIADFLGRSELIIISVGFYALGTMAEALSTNTIGFCAGSILHQIGLAFVVLVVEVIVADISSPHARLIFSYIPAGPLLVNTWVSGDVAASTLARAGWRWGVGMWALIYPASTIPLLAALSIAYRRAARSANLAKCKTHFQLLGACSLARTLFWQLDAVGILLATASLALLLVPVTLAGGVAAAWRTVRVLAPIAVGLVIMLLFIWWERKTKHPLIPLTLFKDRGVWAALGISLGLRCAWHMQGDFLYTVLVVAFDESVKSATRITQMYGFAAVITGPLLGLVVLRVHRLKPFIIVGTCIATAAYGLMVLYRGGLEPRQSRVGVLAAQLVLGTSSGFASGPTLTLMQAMATRRDQLAMMTGLCLGATGLGSALGAALSGVAWSLLLPAALNTRLGPLSSTVAGVVYADPLSWSAANPVGSPARTAVVAAYRDAQTWICLIGACICSLPFICSLFLRNHKLDGQQTVADAEENADYALEVLVTKRT